MIVNRSVLTEQSLDFINARLRRQPKQIALRILAAILGIFFLCVAVLELLSLVKWKSGKLSDGILMVAFGIYAYLLLSRVLFARYFTRRRSKKFASLFAPRTYTVDDTGIAAQHVFAGTQTDRRSSFANAKCYYETADAVYLCFHVEKKQQIYMCMQDSGYSEGSRAELIALLDEKGVRKG